MKPSKGNKCETCDRRFKCLTKKDGDICPLLDGSQISQVIVYKGGISVSTPAGWFYIKKQDLVRIFSRSNYRTFRKYNRNYIEVDDGQTDN